MIATTTSTTCNARWIDDEAFIDALGFEWRGVATIAREMLRAGVPATLQVIRQRMAEFVIVGGVEARGETWRIGSTSEAPPQPINDNTPALKLGSLHHGDCLELMKSIPDHSVSMIIADLPYGTCGGRFEGRNIDIKIDIEAFWEQARRIVAPRGNVVMFCSQPFTTDLINSNREWFKYGMIWKKERATGWNHVRNKPMKVHEDLLLFSPGYNIHARQPGKAGTSENRATYNPWRATETTKITRRKKVRETSFMSCAHSCDGGKEITSLADCPRTVLEYPKERSRRGEWRHPYSKPVALLDDLIRMFSNEGDVVLDPTAGGGSTAVAAINANRRWIAIEKDEGIVAKARARIEAL